MIPLIVYTFTHRTISTRKLDIWITRFTRITFCFTNIISARLCIYSFTKYHQNLIYMVLQQQQYLVLKQLKQLVKLPILPFFLLLSSVAFYLYYKYLYFFLLKLININYNNLNAQDRQDRQDLEYLLYLDYQMNRLPDLLDM